MIDLRRIKVVCPKCKKLICTMEKNAEPRGIHFWCTRCKEEFEIKETKRAREANS